MRLYDYEIERGPRGQRGVERRERLEVESPPGLLCSRICCFAMVCAHSRLVKPDLARLRVSTTPPPRLALHMLIKPGSWILAFQPSPHSHDTYSVFTSPSTIIYECFPPEY